MIHVKIGEGKGKTGLIFELLDHLSFLQTTELLVSIHFGLFVVKLVLLFF